MTEQPGFFARIGRLFTGGNRANGDLPSLEVDHGKTAAEDELALPGTSMLVQPGDGSRGTFLRPWAKRDAAINHLQDGFVALTDLMSSVKDSLDRQSARQDELMQVLSSLPEALKSIPESSAAQTETLRVIAEQVKYQNVQQAKLGEILEKVSETGGNQKEILENLKDRVETLGDQDRNIADNLSNVGAAMQGVSRSAQTSTQVLEQMRDNMSTREGELQRMLQKQSARYTTMLAIAIFLSIAALVAVSIVGYLLMTKGGVVLK